MTVSKIVKFCNGCTPDVSSHILIAHAGQGTLYKKCNHNLRDYIFCTKTGTAKRNYAYGNACRSAGLLSQRQQLADDIAHVVVRHTRSAGQA